MLKCIDQPKTLAFIWSEKFLTYVNAKFNLNMKQEIGISLNNNKKFYEVW